MAFEQVTLKVSPATYQRVTSVKLGLAQAEGRQVTYSEALDRMVELWERAMAAVAEKEAAEPKPIVDLHVEGVITRGKQ